MIYVDDDLLPPIYFNDPKTGKLSDDAYFVIRRELPHKYQMEYLDAAISFELELVDNEDEDGEDESKLKAETNKLKVSQVTDILMAGGLVEIVGVIEKKTNAPITAAEWRRLPSSLLGQISKAIQQTAKSDKKKGKKRPNS